MPIAFNPQLLSALIGPPPGELMPVTRPRSTNPPRTTPETQPTERLPWSQVYQQYFPSMARGIGPLVNRERAAIEQAIADSGTTGLQAEILRNQAGTTPINLGSIMRLYGATRVEPGVKAWTNYRVPGQTEDAQRRREAFDVWLDDTIRERAAARQMEAVRAQAASNAAAQREIMGPQAAADAAGRMIEGLSAQGRMDEAQNLLDQLRTGEFLSGAVRQAMPETITQRSERIPNARSTLTTTAVATDRYGNPIYSTDLLDAIDRVTTYYGPENERWKSYYMEQLADQLAASRPAMEDPKYRKAVSSLLENIKLKDIKGNEKIKEWLDNFMKWSTQPTEVEFPTIPPRRFDRPTVPWFGGTTDMIQYGI